MALILLSALKAVVGVYPCHAAIQSRRTDYWIFTHSSVATSLLLEPRNEGGVQSTSSSPKYVGPLLSAVRSSTPSIN
ncbi:hypothetical protein BO94DRAFT_535513 [Aspergillus sclerotioniger CBS 115572]|uniref:Secreted protein n=1 Tax=Aspergillus sclerotioniger CBS 115572 TaxID=1450535 RepID=A0A317WIP3_9EURO|nr:hypothetical protein BO94DRAFT_535513 [Aspergillus sclerotioniger CBS 115572]PWY86344.1 hypothetical protein BO94DRAFT_535513 [Aspergillus sclerotioniger CBS 115572]